MCVVGITLWLLAIHGLATGSEFPDRECCDLPSPQLTTTTTSSSLTEGPLVTVKGPNTKTTIAILNCLLARQLCFEDASCSSILEIIPRVCGPEVVACSTVTVTKCQAALRTLQAFPFFKPTCLCREPHVDPDCNSFRDFLFDHPCSFVIKKEKDPYPVDALPTCNHALSVCEQEQKCIKLYENFKTDCKVRDNKCRMDDRDLCFQAWTNLRRSPMFGCICPNNQMKKKCDRIFSMVNHNPCVAAENALPTSDGPGDGDDAEGDDYYLDLTGDGAGALLENPLIDVANGRQAYAAHDHVTVAVLKSKGRGGPRLAVYPEEGAELTRSPLEQPRHKHPSPDDENEVERMVFDSTCHTAMQSCQNHYHCRMLLAPILHHCDISRCNRNSCMEALQVFYAKPDFPWNVEIAFCLCKKTENKHDACLVAQQKLHPVCALRTEESPPPTCLHLAEVCRENKECRTKLERYEQSCAVDSVTKKCAGSPLECRFAILGILGTDLRTTCACKGTDMTQLYDCLGWQRLLWVNPCVVESQKNFHLSRAAEMARLTTRRPTTTSTAPAIRRRFPATIEHVTTPRTTLAPWRARVYTMAEFVPPPQAFVPTSTTTTTTKATTTTTRTTRRTKATTSATTLPPRSCVVQRPQFANHFIPEGSFKRIYHEDEFECSDVCECEIGEKLTCRTICIDRMPCKTEFAYYNHAAPAYQAFRGRCLCYSGRFICMKPMPSEYVLPQGVFLFLGYSEVDEKELNKNHTVIVVQDIVRVLQNLIEEEAVNGTQCILEFFNATKENVILVGRLSEEIDYSTLLPAEILSKEKEECVELLETISDRINSRNPDFVSHLLLSIFKMAEVEIVQTETTSSSLKYFCRVDVTIASVTLSLLTRYVNLSLS